MRFFWFGFALMACCVSSAVFGEYGDSMLPSKEIRNRVHRTMRMNMRVGKRFGEDDEVEQRNKRQLFTPFNILRHWHYPIIPNDESDNVDGPLKAKKNLRTIVRTGKRDPQFNTDDFKRSSPQFMMNPRVGKNDITWKNIEKRNDPKNTDMWFGPRIGRSNDDIVEEIPWNYVVYNGKKLSNLPAYKSNVAEEETNEEAAE